LRRLAHRRPIPGIPPQRATAFQDRPAMTRLLDNALERGDAAVLTGGSRVSTGVVSGPGGSARPQASPDYAERCPGESCSA